ncbi:allatostatin-A receptor-like [Amphiura filiformis]|uniref:allatostatin-A receptor-like n=1 Tax=Amphiura filiformis TaxID=82378 RepID=UPI003B2287C0
MDFTPNSSTTEQVFVTTPTNSNPGWAVNEIANSTVVRVVYGIIAFVGLVGNFLVCFTLIKVPALRSRTSLFIIHLAISDIITLTWVIPFHLFPYVPILPQQPGYDALCRLFFSKFPLWTTLFASAYSLLLTTAERYTAIVFPIQYKIIFTKQNSGLMMAACWLIAILSKVYYFGIIALRDGKCGVEWPKDYPSLQQGIGICNIILVYLFPISFMLYAHYKMITELKNRLKEMKARRAGNFKGTNSVGKEAWQFRASNELIKTLLWVVITYAICWAPNQILFFAYNMGVDVDFSQVYYHITVMFAISNSCMNPIIYSMKNKQYRVGLKEALKWGNLSQVAKSGSGSTGMNTTDTSSGAPKTLNTPLASVVTASVQSPPTVDLAQFSNI